MHHVAPRRTVRHASTSGKPADARDGIRRRGGRLTPPMRVWDVHPGYLSQRSLLGEHRELHGVVSILTNGLAGYAAHPETRRWAGLGWALRQRHRLLAAEMAFRGYRDRSPVRTRSAAGRWPEVFVDPPGRQFAILRRKHREKGDGRRGRIPLPRSSHELWAHHKYSVLARDQAACRAIGRRVSALRGDEGFDALALELACWLRRPPAEGEFRNAVAHLWGHVETGPSRRVEKLSPAATLRAAQRGARAGDAPYLLAQTALTELAAWC